MTPEHFSGYVMWPYHPSEMNGYEENDHSAVHHSPGTCPVMSSQPGAPHEALRQQKAATLEGGTGRKKG